MLNLGPSRLVVLSNRGPYATAVVRRRLAVRRNTGGLVTAMEPVLRSQGGVWIAWDDRPPGRPRPPSPPEGRLPFSLRLLPLNEPGTKLLDRQNQLDIRLKRLFRVHGYTFEAQADAYNALNTGVVLTRVQTFGSALDRPASILQGRLIRFGMQAKW